MQRCARQVGILPVTKRPGSGAGEDALPGLSRSRWIAQSSPMALPGPFALPGG
jgi:hypothetical protein